MTVYNLTKRTEYGYSFALKLPPFGVYGFWYDDRKKLVYPPRIMTAKGQVDLVFGSGVAFGRLRDIVQGMVSSGKTKHNTDTQPDPPALFIGESLNING